MESDGGAVPHVNAGCPHGHLWHVDDLGWRGSTDSAFDGISEKPSGSSVFAFNVPDLPWRFGENCCAIWTGVDNSRIERRCVMANGIAARLGIGPTHTVRIATREVLPQIVALVQR